MDTLHTLTTAGPELTVPVLAGTMFLLPACISFASGCRRAFTWK